MQFDELFKREREIVGRVRTVLMASDLDGLPRRQARIDLPRLLGQVPAEVPEFFVLRRRAIGRLLQPATATFQVNERLLEVEAGRGS